MKYTILLMALVPVLLLSGCKKESSTTQSGAFKSTDNVTTTYAVNTTTSVQGEIQDYIELNGDIKSKNEVAVTPDVGGKLTTILVDIGDSVKKNQVVAQVDQSKAGDNYALSPVRSPIDGTITSIPSQIGASVSTTTSIVKVGDLGDLRDYVYISEKYISKIKKGLSALITIDAYPDVLFQGTVAEVSPVVDPDTRMMEIRIKFATNDGKIKAGMYSKVKIITEKKEGIVKIPADAVVKRFSEYFIFVVNNGTGTVEKRKVTRGIQIDSKVEITDGLKANEEVVVRGQTLLEDGSKVKVVDKIAPLDVKDTIE